MDICLDCLQKQKPWVSKDMIIRYAGLNQCDECGKRKKLVYVYTDSDNKLLRKPSVGGIEFNSQWNIHFTSQPPFSINLDEVEITLRILLVNLGWDIVRNYYMYLEGQEDGKPIAFKTHEEYELYLDYRVIKLNPIILGKETTAE